MRPKFSFCQPHHSLVGQTASKILPTNISRTTTLHSTLHPNTVVFNRCSSDNIRLLRLLINSFFPLNKKRSGCCSARQTSEAALSSSPHVCTRRFPVTYKTVLAVSGQTCTTTAQCHIRHKAEDGFRTSRAKQVSFFDGRPVPNRGPDRVGDAHVIACDVCPCCANHIPCYRTSEDESWLFRSSRTRGQWRIWKPFKGRQFHFILYIVQY